MEAFMAAVLFGVGRFDELGGNAELNPPDTEGGEAAKGLGRERDAVVGADAVGEAVLAKEAREHAFRGSDARAIEGLAAEQEAGVGIRTVSG